MHANLIRLISVALLAFACAAGPAVAQDDPSESVDSDGGRLRATPSGATVSPSFAGRGRALRFGEKDDALATPRTRLQEEDDERRLRRARPVRSGQPGIESIIGTDTRTRVTPTTGAPARFAVHILFSDTPGGGDFICTGWLINKNTVVTAGHCVAPGNGSGYYPKSTYRLFPGRNGTLKPYGSCGASKLFSVGRWVNDGRDDYDFAAIKLDCNIGTTTGWFGYQVDDGSVGTRITIQGYPGDMPLGQQWKSTGAVSAQQTRRTFYKNDTIGGMSGSAVWYAAGVAGCRYCGIAIHAYGVYPPGYPAVFRTNNHGTRITQQVFDYLTTWKQAAP